MTCSDFLQAVSEAKGCQLIAWLIVLPLALVGVYKAYRYISRHPDEEKDGWWVTLWVSALFVLVSFGMGGDSLSEMANPVTSSDAKFYCAENPPNVIVEKK